MRKITTAKDYEILDMSQAVAFVIMLGSFLMWILLIYFFGYIMIPGLLFIVYICGILMCYVLEISKVIIHIKYGVKRYLYDKLYSKKDK